MSLVHVPKKAGIIVVKNEKNEHVPTIIQKKKKKKKLESVHLLYEATPSNKER